MKQLLRHIKEHNILLEVVDGELKVFAGAQPVQEQLLTAIKDNRQALIRLLQNNGEDLEKKKKPVRLPVAEEAAAYPLSSSQHRLWVLSQFEAGNIGYSIPGVCVLDGDFDPDAFRRAFVALIDRHEILRTVFKEDEQGNIRQFIQTTASIGFDVACNDHRVPEGTNRSAIHELVEEQFRQPFNLAEGPLLRAGLFRVADRQWVFYYVMHHIISDGWSKKILVRELLQLYHAFSQGTDNPLKPLRLQYKDYSVWQQEQLNSAAMQLQRKWWMEQFEGPLPVLDLPSDKIRPALKTYNGAICNKRIDAQQLKAFRLLCKQEGCTLFMGILAAINTLLFRYTGQQDIVIGTPVAGRDHIDLEDQIGLYANTLALRTRFSGSQHFRSLLQDTRKITTTAYEYQLYPFDKLVGDLGLQRDMGRNPLFDIQVIVQNPDHLSAPRPAGSKQGSAFKVDNFEGVEKQTSVFDLVFNFVDQHDGCLLKMVYNTDVYSEPLIRQLGTHVEQLLRALTAHPDTPIATIDFLSPAEKKLQIADFNKHVLSATPQPTILHCLEEQVMAVPDQLALSYNNNRYTYRQLWDQVDRLACWLRKHHQVAPGALVGIMLPRSDQMIIALLAVLKAGAAYVPIDPEYPRVRKQMMLADAQVQLLITGADFILDVDYYQGALFAIDVELYMTGDDTTCSVGDLKPDDRAYVIFTSGSTGTPNGVVVTHGSLANSIQAQQSVLQVSPGTRYLQVLSFSFDASVLEVFIALANGAALYIVPDGDKKDPLRFEQFVRDHAIQSAVIPPAYLSQLNIDNMPSLSQVVTGGEAPPVGQVNHLLQQADYYNAYGPTECTITATIHKCSRGTRVEGHRTPIGAPIPNTCVYVLDDDHNLLPLGVTGELYISGKNVAKGYLHRPELTSRKFLPDPFRQGLTMYKTGDTGRWLPDGSIEFLGRKDQQVKVRGFRVEPGEIEHVLQQYEELERVAVLAIAGSSGEQELGAYFKSRSPVDTTALRNWLSQSLPGHLVPHHLIEVTDWPLTVNGKLDRSRLPLPAQTGGATGTSYVPPRNDLEKSMVAIWESILNKHPIGIRHNFFELGGDSIKILRLTTAIRKQLQTEVAITDVYKFGSIEGIMDHAVLPAADGDTHQQRAADTAVVRQEFAALQQRILAGMPRQVAAGIASIYPMSDIEKGMVYASLLHPHSGIYHDQMVQQRSFVDFDIERFRKALRLMISKHPILRTGFNIGDHETEVQIVCHDVTVEVPYTSLEGMDRAAQEDALRSFMLEERRIPFQFEKAPLWRMHVFNLGQNEIIFIFQTHHAIIDGWSDASFRTELNNIYLALKDDPQYVPDPLAADYQDFVVQQTAIARDERQHRFWEQELIDLKRLDLFTAAETLDKHSQALPPVLVAQLTQAATGLQTTVKHISIAAYYYLLSVLSNSTEVVAGIVTNNRPDVEDGDKILGCFLNTIPGKLDIDSSSTVAALIATVDRRLLTLKEYDRLSMAAIAGMQKDNAGQANPFFDVVFNYVDFHTYQSVKGHKPSVNNMGAAVRPLQVSGYGRTNTFLDLTINTTGGGYNIGLKLTRQLKTGLTAARIAALYQKILTAFAGDSFQTIGTISLLDEADKALQLSSFNQTLFPIADGATIPVLFEARAAQQPAYPAMTAGGRTITYGELNEATNRFSRYLIDHCALNPGGLAGVMLEPGIDRVIAMLGILKAGAAFLPIDPAYPVSRVDYLVNDSRCQLLVDAVVWSGFLTLEPTLAAGKLPGPVSPSDLAYVIYTSGSTGHPKGVMITHQALINLCYWHNERFAVMPTDKATLYAGVGFDAAIWELFPYLLAGASLYQVPDDKRHDIDALADLYNEEAITIGFLPTQVAEQFLEKENHSLRFLLTGGDRLKVAGNTTYQLINNYGPTECTVVATSGTVVAGLPDIPIGKPISNIQVSILNRQNNLLPAGVPGEICLSGAGLALGYLHQPELSARKFVPHPYQKGTRMYRTGDLGRWLPDGQIEFLGRIDDQVKVRGYRIEPREIETALLQDPAVVTAAVIAREGTGGENELVAFVVLRHPGAIDTLRTTLAQVLPLYLVPQQFVALEKMPLTQHGKVDTRQLQQMVPVHTAAIRSYMAPRHETDVALAGLFTTLLGKSSIGITDDFFENGGHSLLAMRLVTQINRQLHVQLSIRDLYNHPTVEALSNHLTDPGQSGSAGTTPIDLHQECRTDIDYSQLSGLLPVDRHHEQVFITGATGFVGCYLLKELLVTTQATIYCLVRAGNQQEGWERIKAAMECYALYNPAWKGRIVAVPGDLALPGLGIEKEQYLQLALQTDTIYHVGAYIDLMASYEKLKPANVGSAIEMIRLATHTRLKKLIYTSTLSVFNSNRVATRQESDQVDGESHLQSAGYSGSKWVAEKILQTAAGHGLPVQIHRLGLITGDAVTGRMPGSQWFPQLLRLCHDAGGYPAGYKVPATPVDFVAAAIVCLSASGTGTYHLANSSDLPIEAFFSPAAGPTRPIARFTPGQWLAAVRALPAGQSSALIALLSYTFNLDADADYSALSSLPEKKNQIATRETLRQLASLGVSFPDTGLYVDGYLASLL